MRRTEAMITSSAQTADCQYLTGRLSPKISGNFQNVNYKSRVVALANTSGALSSIRRKHVRQQGKLKWTNLSNLHL